MHTDDVNGAAATPTTDAEKKEQFPALKIPLSLEECGLWKTRVSASERVMEQKRDTEWKEYVRAYMARTMGKAPEEHEVRVPLEFSYVELKKAQLAFQVPEVHLTPRNPDSAPAVPVFQVVLNHELGPDNADVKTCIDECLTDVLTCSTGASKIGYVAHLRTRQVPVLRVVVDAAGQPMLDRRTGVLLREPVRDPVTGEPQMQEEQFLAGEEYFWDRFPLEHLLMPPEFESSDHDRGAWMGMIFELPFSTVHAQYGLTEEMCNVSSSPRDTLSSDEQPSREHTSAKKVKGYEIWYRADVFDPDSNALPGQLRRLILIDGCEYPVVHDDSPYQWVGQDGRLKGMEGFPIHPLTLRFLPGSAYPVGDVEMGLPLSEEISTGRTQMVQHRDRVKPFRAYNRTKIDPEILEKLKAGEIGDWIGFDADVREAVGIVTPPAFPRENFDFDQVARRDFEQTWAMGRAQTGVTEDTAKTATEIREARGATDVRLDAERTRVLNWFTKGAAKFASLLQRFKDEREYVEIVGENDAKSLQAWNKDDIQGEFIFRAQPDSSLRIDADVQRRQDDNLYNLIRRDPNVRGTELLRAMIRRRNLDPAKIVVETPPPEPKPEPPKISLSFKGEDLSNPMVLAILAQTGIKIPGVNDQPPPQPGQPGQPGMAPHPGATPTIDLINKHALHSETSTNVM